MKAAKQTKLSAKLAEVAASIEARTAYIHFPDEHACVKILDILAPYRKEAKTLILNVVAANLGHTEFPRMLVTGDNQNGIRTVVMPLPLASARRRK